MLKLGKIELATLAQVEPFTGHVQAVYPRAVFIAQRVFGWDVFVTAIQFSTSLVIFPGALSDYGGMFITLDQAKADFIAVSETLQSVVDHHTFANSIPGATPLASPSSKVSNIKFDGCGYDLKSNSPIGLWAFAEATAGNSLLAVTSIQYRRVLER